MKVTVPGRLFSTGPQGFTGSIVPLTRGGTPSPPPVFSDQGGEGGGMGGGGRVATPPRVRGVGIPPCQTTGFSSEISPYSVVTGMGDCRKPWEREGGYPPSMRLRGWGGQGVPLD